MPPDRTSRPRQDLVSCQLCRTKKLKCNREQPCQNCLTRGLTCERQSRLPPAAANRRPHVPVIAAENASILARLQRLEDLVLGSNRIEASPCTYQQQWSQSPAPSSISEREESHDADAKWLESVGLWEQSLLADLSGHVKFRVGPTQPNLKNGSSLDRGPDGSVVRCIWLPLQTEAALLFENFTQNVNEVYQILHLPTVRILLDELYLRLARGYEVKLGHAALLLSIFANSAYFWAPNNCDSHLFANTQEAVHGALLWSKAAVDVMDHAHRSSPRGIEDVQARMILGLLVYSYEGFSTVARSLYTSAFGIARSLNLHRTDCNSSKRGVAKSRDNRIEMEIRRRVWWHLAATDWILALNGGFQEGTYTIQPRHMKVNLPRNVNDEDLGNEDVDLPLSEPTSMSYFLQRLRLAELSRSVADHMPLTLSDPETTAYEDVIFLDGKFENFLNELPLFFRLDEESLQQSRDTDQKHPHIPIQRYMINGGIHTRRYKLHQPYLIRGLQGSLYLYSRDACLRSARAVIQVQTHLQEQTTQAFASPHHRLCAVVHFVFSATMVLVMDLCFNKVEGQDEQRRAEVMNACKILENAREQSTMARRFLESLLDILRKHKIRLPINSAGLIDTSHVTGSDVPLPPMTYTPSSAETASSYEMIPSGNTWVPDGQKDLDSGIAFDEVWQNYIEYGENLEMLDWDHLFSDLDSHLA